MLGAARHGGVGDEDGRGKAELHQFTKQAGGQDSSFLALASVCTLPVSVLFRGHPVSAQYLQRQEPMRPPLHSQKPLRIRQWFLK